MGLFVERAGRARSDAFAAGHARRLAHRVVEIEGDPGRIALSRAADDVVALDVVAGADAAVAEDARVVVDGDDRVGEVLAATRAARQLGRLLLEAVLPNEHQQLVVGGRGLLRILLDRRLVDQQQLGQLRTVAVELGRRGLDLHPVLTRPHAGRRVDARPDIDDAHATHADGVVALVVAKDRNLDPDLPGGRPDRRALGHGDLLAVDGEADGLDLGGCGRRDGHDCLRISVAWTGGRLRDPRNTTGRPWLYPEVQVVGLTRAEQAVRVQPAGLVVALDHRVEALSRERGSCVRRQPRAAR